MILADSPNPARGTRRAALALLLLCAAWGATFRVRVLVASAVAGVGVALVLALYPRAAARRVAIARDVGDRAFEDDEVVVGFALENRGRLPLVLAEVEDRFPPDPEIFRRAPVPAWIPGRSRVATRYRANCYGKRGGYQLGPALVRLADPLGFFPVDVTLELDSPFVVYPRVVPLPPLPAAGRGLPLSSATTARVPGESAEALSVREYRPGDPLRRIHWPTTARRGRLAVLELEQEHARDVAIFIDLDRRTLRGLGRRSTLEHSVRIAASAAQSYLRRGDRVRLVARGREPMLVPPGTGERHLALVLEELSRVRPEGEIPLEVVIEEAAPSLPPGSTAFVVLPAADQATGPRTAAIAALRARGCDVVCVLLDERTFLAIFREQQRSLEERVDLPRAADALMAEGALVYVVRQGDDLATCFLAPHARPS